MLRGIVVVIVNCCCGASSDDIAEALRDKGKLAQQCQYVYSVAKSHMRARALAAVEAANIDASHDALMQTRRDATKQLRSVSDEYLCVAELAWLRRI